jgi:hypothetical protein
VLDCDGQFDMAGGRDGRAIGRPGGHFLQWTWTLIKDNANFESTVYEEYQEAVQREGQPHLDFDAYLSAVERELPKALDAVSANIFYSKLHQDVRKQIKLSGLTALPTTRTEMVHSECGKAYDKTVKCRPTDLQHPNVLPAPTA